MQTVRLNNGMEMPMVGFGVYQVSDAETEKAVLEALKAGYRLLDTAAVYGNEAGVGRAIKASGIAREAIFFFFFLWIKGEKGYVEIGEALGGLLRCMGFVFFYFFFM